MPMKRIRLELARNPEFPEGSRDRGYDIVAPLDADGYLDANEWREHRGSCRVRRFWHGSADQQGWLVHKAGGSEGATWIFDYDQAGEADDERGFKLGLHRFRPGEYVSVTEPDGERHAFRIVAIGDAE